MFWLHIHINFFGIWEVFLRNLRNGKNMFDSVCLNFKTCFPIRGTICTKHCCNAVSWLHFIHSDTSVTEAHVMIIWRDLPTWRWYPVNCLDLLLIMWLHFISIMNQNPPFIIDLRTKWKRKNKHHKRALLKDGLTKNNIICRNLTLRPWIRHITRQQVKSAEKLASRFLGRIAVQERPLLAIVVAVTLWIFL